MKEYMIEVIRQHQYYTDGILEAMTEEQVREIFEALLDWMA